MAYNEKIGGGHLPLKSLETYRANDGKWPQLNIEYFTILTYFHHSLRYNSLFYPILYY